MYTSTIAAIATGYTGVSAGVGIIRISGGLAYEIQKKIFKSFNGKAVKPRYAAFGNFCDEQNAVLDNGLVLYMPSPFSYTGEDVVEFQCHGNPVILHGLLELCYKYGAEPAKAGEFTKRAFLNGKLDLSQAEAVAELIASPTIEGVKLAEAKMEGLLSRKIKELKEEVELCLQNILYELDFSEDDFASFPQFIQSIENVVESIETLIAAYDRAIPWREGQSVVLAGKTNTGKSSLFNALLGRYRAIVTPQAGTTRDYIEELLTIHTIPIRLIDTAGLRKNSETTDIIELEGIKNAHVLLEKAHLILYLINTNSLDFEEDKAQLALIQEKVHCPVLLIWNKEDIKPIPANMPFQLPLIGISAKNGIGIEKLCKEIALVLQSNLPASQEIAPNLRQVTALKKARAELQVFLHEAEQGILPDALALYLNSSSQYLAEITGQFYTEDLVNKLFDSFCIGK